MQTITLRLEEYRLFKHLPWVTEESHECVRPSSRSLGFEIDYRFDISLYRASAFYSIGRIIHLGYSAYSTLKGFNTTILLFVLIKKELRP